ncbi:MAG: hypothetical protein AB4372_16660 [Xenococcus sp. (in: cyanobacteria)]
MNQSKTNNSPNSVESSSENDQRPHVWVGHVFMETNNFDSTLEFLKLIGMRLVASSESFAVLELRGGTHLVLRSVAEARATEVSFDLMVEDIEAQHQDLAAHNYNPSPIQKGKIHHSFEVSEPGGNKIRFNSSHVIGIV